MRLKKKNRKPKGVCLWNRIEHLFDVAKHGVEGRKLNKLHLRIAAANRELYALRRRGIEGIDALDILNRDGCERKIGPAEFERHATELSFAFRKSAEHRAETHTIEVPRWLMEKFSRGEFTVARGLALLFYLYRRLVKNKDHFNNWISKGKAYARFKLADLKEWCGIHMSRGSASLRWLEGTGILKRSWVPYFERMKRGACYVDGPSIGKNGNQFGRNRKSVFRFAENQETYKETDKEREIFSLMVDDYGRVVATRA